MTSWTGLASEQGIATPNGQHMNRAASASAAGEHMPEPFHPNHRGPISRGTTLTDTGEPLIQLHLESHLDILVKINLDKSCGDSLLSCADEAKCDAFGNTSGS